jgi:penicillin-binding protein 2
MALFNQSRSTIIRLIFGAVFLIIIIQLFNLQIISGKYRELAMNNAVFPKVRYPDRGIIYDRKGKAILNNTIMYDLVVTPNEARKIDTIGLCQLLEIDTAEFKKRMIEARLKNGPYRPTIFEDLLPPALHARLNENIWKYPGFALVERPVRVYPFNAAAHIMGYIGEADSGIIKRSKGFYRLGDYVGRNGLESYYEKVLMGQRGVQYMIKDNKNRLVGSYENGAFDTAAIAGRNLRTYIDIEVQQLAERLMTNKVGAVVAIEPKTGGIIAMVSGPNYNPNDLTGPDKQKNFARMQLDVKGPMLNRAIQGNYEPGSTFKPLGALVALDEGVISANYGYPCGGRYLACGHGKPKCLHNNAGHAANLRLSIANSCNSYYAHVYRLSVDNPKFGGVRNGYSKWREYMMAFGLGVRTGVDLPAEDRGLIPDTSVYNRVYRNSWNSCTNLTLGIGQDMMQATPLQLANAMCIIANKGYYYTPHFVRSVDGETADDTLLTKFKVKHQPLKVSEADFEEVIAGMHDVVERGTAQMVKIPGVLIAAKTGTAEKFRIIDREKVKLKDNSMFVCFAPIDDPKIAIAVVVENSGFGGTWAAPIASLMMEKYLNDTLRPERVKEVERISAANLLPGYFERLQFIEDSTRAERWREMTGDSTRIRRFLRRGPGATTPAPAERQPTKPITSQAKAIIPDRQQQYNKPTQPVQSR